MCLPKPHMSDTVKRMDTLTLVHQHGWRVSFIIGFLAIAIRAVLSSNQLIEYIVGVLMVIVFLNWLRMEISTVSMRRNLPPGSLGLPFVGDALKMLTNPVKYSEEKVKKFGRIFSESGIALSVVFTYEEAVMWLWNTERKGQAEVSWPPHIRKLLGDGAVANTMGKQHRTLRRILEPAFTPHANRDYVQVLDDVTQQSLSEWSKGSGIFRSSNEFKMYALHLFFIAAFGRVEQDLIQQLHDDFVIWINGFGSLLPLRIPGTLFGRAMDARDRILDTVETLIVQFKAENSKDSERGQKSMMGRICYATDEDGHPMAMNDLKDNVLNMIFAGHDTTYASMGTALHYLAECPTDLLAELIKEVNGFTNKYPLDYDELKHAPILNAFLAECWRMDPPVGGSFRKLRDDLDFNGWKLPKDIVIRYDILAMTQNEERYRNPSQFDLQRFLPVDHPLLVDRELHATGVDYNNMKANYPIFGSGTHGCLGSNFAKLEMRVLLTRMLQSYHVEVQHSEKVFFPVNGWKNEFKLTPKKRKIIQNSDDLNQ